MKGDSRPARGDPPDGAKRLKGTAERRMRKAESSGQCGHRPLPSRTRMAPVCGLGARTSCPPNRASHREVSPCCGPVATPRKTSRMPVLPSRRSGGGTIILRAGHFGVFAKRSQMMGASRFEKLRFPVEKRVFQCAGTAESKSFFTKRSQMWSGATGYCVVSVSAGLRPIRRHSHPTPKSAQASRDGQNETDPNNNFLLDPTRSD